MEKQSVYRSPMAGASVASFLRTVLFLWNFQGTVLLLKKNRQIGVYGIDRTGENT